MLLTCKFKHVMMDIWAIKGFIITLVYTTKSLEATSDIG